MPALPAPPESNRSEPGFQSLFNGLESPDQVFSKWRMVGFGDFVLRERVLMAEPGPQIGVLYYAAERFNDFVLRLDFLLPKPAGEGNDNSGIHLRFRNPLAPTLPGMPQIETSDNPANVAVNTGYEVQIDEEARGDSRQHEAHGHFYNRTGAIYKIKASGEAPGQQDYCNQQQLAAMTWHTLEVTVRGHAYEVLLNGRPATRFIADPGEGFRGQPNCQDPESGFIGLQAHTGHVSFANLRIKRL